MTALKFITFFFNQHYNPQYITLWFLRQNVWLYLVSMCNFAGPFIISVILSLLTFQNISNLIDKKAYWRYCTPCLNILFFALKQLVSMTRKKENY